ncbi:MAG: GGDEF domain-containing protein [Mesorhizobium sp.]|nr:GGDEF domain-containing protein [Mesorhizobium sp.]
MITTTDSKDAELKLALIDQALDKKGILLRFPGPLEAQCEEETGSARVRMSQRNKIIATLLMCSLIVLDYFCVPDVLWLAFVLRFGLITGVVALAYWIDSRDPPLWVRESLTVVIAVTMSLAVLIIVAASNDPLRENYHLGILFLMMIAVVAVRPRFPYAVVTAIALVALEGLTAWSVDTMPIESKFASVFLPIVFAGFALPAVHNLEMLERQNWLRSVRDRLRASLFEELSIIDPMTGLGNRRAMLQWVERTMKRGQTDLVSIVMADIDHFKSYNDTFGHLAGDDCIRRVAGVLVSEARGAEDRVFRFGGEEFVTVLPGIGMSEAIAVAERTRRAIAAKGIPHRPPGGLRHVTVSFGVASGELGPAVDLNTLIADADRSLYVAKQSGRNRVIPPLVALAEPGLRDAV